MMSKEKTLALAQDLMEPFNNIAINFHKEGKEEGWEISVPEKGGIYKEQIKSLIEIAAKHKLDYSIEGDEIFFWEVKA